MKWEFGQFNDFITYDSDKKRIRLTAPKETLQLIKQREICSVIVEIKNKSKESHVCS